MNNKLFNNVKNSIKNKLSNGGVVIIPKNSELTLEQLNELIAICGHNLKIISK
jgi:hypothetical protein